MHEFISLKRLPCAHILFLSVITFNFNYIYIHNLNLIYHIHSKYTWHVFTQRLQQKQNAYLRTAHDNTGRAVLFSVMNTYTWIKKNKKQT
jgi:hypothetical protein